MSIELKTVVAMVSLSIPCYSDLIYGTYENLSKSRFEIVKRDLKGPPTPEKVFPTASKEEAFSACILEDRIGQR